MLKTWSNHYQTARLLKIVFEDFTKKLNGLYWTRSELLINQIRENEKIFAVAIVFHLVHSDNHL